MTNRLLELITRTFNCREIVVGENDIKTLFIYSIDEEIPGNTVM